jgi:hypothetical protein
MQLSRFLLASVLACAPSLLLAQNENSVADLPKLAVERSQLTLPGSRPFHIKLRVREGTNPDNEEYNGDVEEYWAAPDKWRRTVKTVSFSQTLIVNGEKTEEHLTGSYYPNWMRTLVDAALDPGAALEGVDLSQSTDNPEPTATKVCRRFDLRAGMPPVSNRVFSSYCFQNGLIESADRPGYSARYTNYRKFAGKDVAYKITEYIEPGTELAAVITELTEMEKADDAMFAIQQPTSRLQTIQTDEPTLRALAVDPPAMFWPLVRGGRTAGVLSIYVCIGRDGHVQETYGLNSDHPDMTDAARQQLTNWKFNPTVQNGEPEQVEGILTFAYQTKIGDPYPVLSDSEARKQAVKIVEPHFRPGTPKGMTGTVRVLVGEDGTVHSTSPENLPNELLGAVLQAISQWQFQPYLKDGKPTEFNADLTFSVK